MSARQVHVLLSYTDAEAEAMRIAGTSPEAFVQSIRTRWAWQKRNAQEMFDTLKAGREAGQDLGREWGAR